MAYLPTYEQARTLLENHSLSGRATGASTPPPPYRQVWAFCPSHKDGEGHGRRSLSLHPKYGLKCWSGCDKKDILDALGWTPQQDEPERRNGHSPQQKPPYRPGATAHTPRRPPDYEWKFRDENDAVVAIHGRWDLRNESKTFAWRLPESRDWTGLGDELTERELPPYGLADLLDPARKSEPVWIVEGEKDCEAAKDFGKLLCISWGGGADQRFFPRHYLKYLENRDLILWPDNDVPGWSFSNRFAIVTREIARSSRILLVPGAKEKEGAYDWFVRRHGSVQELLDSLDGVITAPTTAFLSADSIQITLPVETDGPVQMTFKNIQATIGGRDGHALNSKMEVNKLGPAKREYAYVQRINLLSHSSRQSCARELKSVLGTLGAGDSWDSLLNTATVLVDRGLATRQRGIDMASIASPGAAAWHIEGKYPLNEISLVFGDGQQMKSLQLQYEVICAALGLDIAAKYSAMPGTWVWVDYEQNGPKFRLRGERLLNGLGYDEVPSMLVKYYPAEGLPIVDLIPNLISYCEEVGAVGYVIDSAMPACGGDPNDNGLVTIMFNELAKLRMTGIILAHVTKGGKNWDQKPFGAASWYFRPSQIWFVERNGIIGHPDQLRCQWFPRKWRDNHEPPSQAFVWTFDDPIGHINVELGKREISHHERPEIAIAAILADAQPRSVFELSEILEHSTRVIQRTLKLHPELFVRIDSESTVRWTLVSLREQLSLLPAETPGTNGATREIPPELANDKDLAPLLKFPHPQTATDDLPFDSGQDDGDDNS